MVSKHGWPRDYTEDYERYVFDVCDDHFSDHLAEHYLKHCDQADLITCSTPELAKIIKDRTEREAIVIPDPIELETQAPHVGKNLFWFGHETNFKELQRVMPSLVGYDITVMSRPFNDKVVPWSLDNLYRELGNAGIVVIPTNKDKPGKSANRLIEAINGGCFVVCEDLPAYREFAEYCWIGDIREGCDWVLGHMVEALEKVIAGQDHICRKYSIDSIGPQWDKALRWVM